VVAMSFTNEKQAGWFYFYYALNYPLNYATQSCKGAKENSLDVILD
jgi:hypothetical protein